MLKPILIGIAIVAGLIIADRVLLWMEARNWIYYRRTRGSHGGIIVAPLVTLREVVHPETREAKEYLLEEKKEQNHSGDPPVPGGKGPASSDQ